MYSCIVSVKFPSCSVCKYQFLVITNNKKTFVTLFFCKEKERNIYVQQYHLHVQLRISIYYLSVVSIKYGVQTADWLQNTDYV